MSGVSLAGRPAAALKNCLLGPLLRCRRNEKCSHMHEYAPLVNFGNPCNEANALLFPTAAS